MITEASSLRSGACDRVPRDSSPSSPLASSSPSSSSSSSTMEVRPIVRDGSMDAGAVLPRPRCRPPRWVFPEGARCLPGERFEAFNVPVPFPFPFPFTFSFPFSFAYLFELDMVAPLAGLPPLPVSLSPGYMPKKVPRRRDVLDRPLARSLRVRSCLLAALVASASVLAFPVARRASLLRYAASAWMYSCTLDLTPS